jgi:hypothetical protein
MNAYKTFGLLVSSMLLALTACGSSTLGGNGGSGNTGNTGTGATDTGGSGTGGSGGATLDCAMSFPTFDKTCTADTDCVTKLHQINCCGTQKAIGVAKSDSASFDSIEAACDWPKCGCATMPTEAEDGTTSASFGDAIPVACKAGQCTTYIPNGLCKDVPAPLNCEVSGCPEGWTCTKDPDPTTCHSSACQCSDQGWQCTSDCGTNGSSCMKGL